MNSASRYAALRATARDSARRYPHSIFSSRYLQRILEPERRQLLPGIHRKRRFLGTCDLIWAAGLGLCTACCQGERPTNLPHLFFAQGADECAQSTLVHGLHMVKIDCGVVLQALFRADWHLARQAPYRRRDRCDHRGAQKRKNLLPGENHDGSALVGFAEFVLPDFPSPGTSP